MLLAEQCKTCKNNRDGHCIVGNNVWRAKNINVEVECEEHSSKLASFLQAGRVQGD
jgi:hypothetical protein